MRSRTRLIAIVASLLVCIAMVGTGFASWVILDTQTKTSTGNVTAEEVSSEGITLTVSPENDGSIIFGSPADATSGWLIESEANGQGKLSVDITVTVQGNVGSFTIGFATTGETYNTAKTAHLVADYPTYTLGSTAPTGVITSTDDITVTDNKNGTATLSFGSEKTSGYNFSAPTTFHIVATFGWGTAFNSENPYEFFNGDDRTVNGTTASADATDLAAFIKAVGNNAITGTSEPATWGAAAKNVLSWMHTNFTNVTYTFTFTATQAAPTKS